MTPAETRAAVDALHMTQREIAEAIGISHGHLRNVLSGRQTLSRPAQMLLQMLVVKSNGQGLP